MHTLTGRLISDRVKAAGAGGQSQQDAHSSAQGSGSPASVMRLGFVSPTKTNDFRETALYLSLRCLTDRDDVIGVQARPYS